jgi:hypothetical protein
MCFLGFLCFNGVRGFLHVYSILVNCIFQVYVSVMFLYQAYVYVSRPCFRWWACLCIKAMFQYQSSQCFSSRAYFSSRFLVHFMVYYLFIGVQMVLYFYGSMLMCFYVSLFPSIQKTFIQKLHCLFAGFYVSCIIFLICVKFSLVIFLLCFTFLGFF